MSYSNATFYLDYESGSDTARADLVPTAYANNGSGLVRVTCNSTAAYSTGAVFDIAGTSSSLYVGGWIVTVIDSTHVDLQGSTFTSNPATKGTMIPRGGSSMADAWKTLTSGPTSARTTSGDTVRIKGSPAATSLGQSAQWTEAGPNNTTYAIVSSTNATPIVVTLSSGNYTLLAPAVGDTIIVNGHTTNTKANGVWNISAVDGTNHTVTLQNADGTNSVGNGVGGASGTVRKINNLVVKLTTAVTKAIAVVGNQGAKANWTPITVPGVNTCSVITSDFKEGGECQQIGIAAAHVTGLAAFFATGTLDLSAYQQVTFWVKQTAGTVVIAGDASLRLCTDTLGVVSVHTVAIPALGALNQWVPVTVDLGGALNSAIASVALYIDTDRGAQTFQIDCINAAKASSSDDSLTHTSLISKNTGNEPWCQIQSINGTRVVLDGVCTDKPAGNPQRGYSGTTESVTTYKRETIKTAMVATAATAISTLQSAATFSGGWDRTNMTTQNLETFYDGQNGMGIGVSYVGASAPSISKVHPYRCDTGYKVLATTVTGTTYMGGISTSGFVGLSTVGAANGTFITFGCGTVISIGGSSAIGGYTFTALYSVGDVSPVSFSPTVNGSSVMNNSITTVSALNAAGSGIYLVGRSFNNKFGSVTSKYCGGAGVSYGINGLTSGVPCFNKIGNLITQSNIGAGIQVTGHGNDVGGGSSSGNAVAGVSAQISATAVVGTNTFRNFTVSDTTQIGAQNAFGGASITFENYGGVSGDHRIFTDGGGSPSTGVGAIVQQTATKHGSDNYGWKFSPTSSNRSAAYPLERTAIKFPVKANALVTVSRWVQRDNTGLTLRLVCNGGQLNGVASDVIATASASINTWEQLTITFTPTEAGVIAITEQAWGGTTYNGFTSDWSVTQA